MLKEVPTKPSVLINVQTGKKHLGRMVTTWNIESISGDIEGIYCYENEISCIELLDGTKIYTGCWILFNPDGTFWRMAEWDEYEYEYVHLLRSR